MSPCRWRPFSLFHRHPHVARSFRPESVPLLHGSRSQQSRRCSALFGKLLLRTSGAHCVQSRLTIFIITFLVILILLAPTFQRQCVKAITLNCYNIISATQGKSHSLEKNATILTCWSTPISPNAIDLSFSLKIIFKCNSIS